MPTRYNSRIHATDPPSLADAAPVIILRAAGALIFGKTTTTEFAATSEGGPCCNPHDLTRTPGGSSSGSGAAVADFQVPIALGTQTGGSTIRPGSFNGIYAFKPTWGAISREGLAQYSVTCDTVGLYARSVEDLQMLSDVFRLADDEPVAKEPFDVSGAKIAFCRTHVWPKAGQGTEAAFEKARKLLEGRGAVVQDIDLPEDFASVSDWHAAVLAGEGRTSFLGRELIIPFGRASPATLHLLMHATEYLHDKDKLATFLHGHVENQGQLSRKAQLEAYDGCARLRPMWDDIASHFDAVITPSVPDVAPVGLENTGDASFCSTWTILQVPALNIPGFKGGNDMPIGITLVGARYRDQHVLHVGEAIGKVFETEGDFQSKLP